MKMYAAFPSKAEGVAYDLMEALSDYCKRKNSKTFELIPRLSKEKINPKRWDIPWVEDSFPRCISPCQPRQC